MVQACDEKRGNGSSMSDYENVRYVRKKKVEEDQKEVDEND